MASRGDVYLVQLDLTRDSEIRAETQLILILLRLVCAVGRVVTGMLELPLRIDDVVEITLVPSDAVPRIRTIGKVFTVSRSLLEA